ncbi:MAG: hypothetical protein E5W65_10250 [Mesorhizobium sp.]|uniref:hypothetical protein n=1 Tax=Mesorhizobium sp. TaxID=1871066 RepID=UPI00121FD44D|nr:hypothetical protein [Mesorhizobium sp.]TIT36141.1 MAG: hypothetical protein E5W65_10250 [Mesorhizobium sp.]
MNSHHNGTGAASIVWISDAEVRSIFGRTRCFHRYGRKEANAQFVREKRANDGSLGYVMRDPVTRANWLWIIGRRDRRPFAVCVVS